MLHPYWIESTNIQTEVCMRLVNGVMVSEQWDTEVLATISAHLLRLQRRISIHYKLCYGWFIRTQTEQNTPAVWNIAGGVENEDVMYLLPPHLEVPDGLDAHCYYCFKVVIEYARMKLLCDELPKQVIQCGCLKRKKKIKNVIWLFALSRWKRHEGNAATKFICGCYQQLHYLPAKQPYISKTEVSGMSEEVVPLGLSSILQLAGPGINDLNWSQAVSQNTLLFSVGM